MEMEGCAGISKPFVATTPVLEGELWVSMGVVSFSVNSGASRDFSFSEEEFHFSASEIASDESSSRASTLKAWSLLRPSGTVESFSIAY